MKNLVIVGAGAIAAEVTSYLSNSYISDDSEFSLKGYLEYQDRIEKYHKYYELEQPVLGELEDYIIQEDDVFIIAVLNMPFKQKAITILQNKNARFTNLIHASTNIARTVVLGHGNIIYPNCIFGPKCQIGNFNILTSYSFISHDCIIGDCNFFATSGLSGYVHVHDNNNFGIRSTVLPNISIGSNNIIQAGMIVDKDVPNDATVFHRFKEKLMIIKSVET